MSCWGSFEGMCKKIVSPTRHGDLNQHDMRSFLSYAVERKFKGYIPPYEVFLVPNSEQRLLSVLSLMLNVEAYPTVIYLHGNGGHKMESLHLILDSNQYQINLVAFDFGACGKSQGECLTYGQQEAKDVGVVVDEVRRRYGVRKISIWGRSMGASIAIMYASLFPRHINCLVLDTPFRWLRQVVRNVGSINSSVPNFLLDIGMNLVESKLTQILNGQNIFATDFKMYLNLLEVPALFIASVNDQVVKEDDVKALFEAYKGRKELKNMTAMHHEDRPRKIIEEGLAFLLCAEQEDGSKSSRSSTMGTDRYRKGISMSLRGQHLGLSNRSSRVYK